MKRKRKFECDSCLAPTTSSCKSTLDVSRQTTQLDVECHMTNKGTLISAEIIDEPTQRLYIVVLFVLIQSLKLNDRRHVVNIDSINFVLWKWIIIDWSLAWIVKKLRIPRMETGWKGTLLMYAGLVGLNWFIFGDWRVSSRSFDPSEIPIRLSIQCRSMK